MMGHHLLQMFFEESKLFAISLRNPLSFHTYHASLSSHIQKWWQYLSNAVVQAKNASDSDSMTNSSRDSGLLDLLEGVVSRLEAAPSTTESVPNVSEAEFLRTVKEKVKELSLDLKSITQLYNEYAVPFELWEDTLRSTPAENKVMKRASIVGVSASTLFYMICGTLGYATFGNDAPGNYLTSFGFYEPFWLIDFGNLCIVIHLLGAYRSQA